MKTHREGQAAGAPGHVESGRWRFDMFEAESADAAPIRCYIRDQFARHYGASIREFLPLQLAILRGDELKAAAGLRPADRGPLFIEQYLDTACETELATHFGIARPNRATIGEVGNLAATDSGASRELFIHIAAVARSLGLAWLTCNATPRVQAILRYMNLPFSRLHAADPDRIPDRERWGTYYDQPTHVMAGPVAGIIDAMLTTDPFRLAFAECRARSAAAMPAATAGDRSPVPRQPVAEAAAQSLGANR